MFGLPASPVNGSSGSSSDGPIFNRSDLREKIEDGSFGLLQPELLVEGGLNLHYFLLGVVAFSLMPWRVTPYRQLTKEEKNSKLQDLQRQEGGGEPF